MLRAHGGAEIKTMGDGFMASFASPARAVECAIALQRAFEEMHHGPGADPSAEPIHIRIGLNAGEPIEEGGDLFGATVIMASRIAAHANAGEILASDVVRGLCAGKGLLFADRGENVLRGFEDAVRLYEVSWQS
jgi:class 3 adenylate cyclase